MPLPKINILFQEAASTAIKRGERGIVALILKDSVHNGAHVYETLSDIPSDLSTANKKQIELAFMGGENPPLQLLVYILPTAASSYTSAQTYLEGSVWNYLAVPGISSADATTIATWVKGLRDTLNLSVKAVLPNTAADHEGVINFATDNIVAGGTTYTTANYSSRIAGILAGNPLSISSTFQVLSEVDDVPHSTTSEFNTAIDAGKLVLMNDGEKVKIARAVNSLTTLTSNKGAAFKKIKLVDIMDMIYADIKKTTNDAYIGKLPNTYDNKCLLITAIRAYYESLENQQLLDRGKNSVDIDITAQKTYLQSIGVNTSAMTDQQIKEANTGDKIFLSGPIKIVDAIEDFELKISI
ncbi:phage tail sheath subtilisin-like domain-containing protein [Dehalobacter sp. DCM]|uniref:phage tail sheath subtilisin-like domain-containing protein n=1 Tax=Dehalobacter sp. DCM TaxID=2907827 RepID=UPI00308134EA|nr:phage tail sheath subtilisin-like domain-containing protein [Dehalobacter sp. DCM]